MLWPPLGLIALVAVAGCGVSRTAVFPPEPADLAALTREADGRAYEVLGVIQVDGKNFTREETLVSRLREKARELGADDVLQMRVMSLPRGDGLFNGAIRLHFFTVEGVAVRWTSLPIRKGSLDSGKASQATD